MKNLTPEMIEKAKAQRAQRSFWLLRKKITLK